MSLFKTFTADSEKATFTPEPSFLGGLDSECWVHGKFGSVFKVNCKTKFGHIGESLQFYRSAFFFLLGNDTEVRWLFLVVTFKFREKVSGSTRHVYESRCYAVLIGAVPPKEGFYEKQYAIYLKPKDEWTSEEIQSWPTFYPQMTFNKELIRMEPKSKLSIEVTLYLEPKRWMFENPPGVYFSVVLDDYGPSKSTKIFNGYVNSDDFSHEKFYSEIETDVIGLDSIDPRKNQFFEISNTAAFYKELEAWAKHR